MYYNTDDFPLALAKTSLVKAKNCLSVQEKHCILS